MFWIATFTGWLVLWAPVNLSYRQVSVIRRTLVGSKIVDDSDVVGSIACRRCSNYIFILDLTPGFIGLGKDNCKSRRETVMFGELVCLILEILRYLLLFTKTSRHQISRNLEAEIQSDTFIVTANLAASRFHEIWWKYARLNSEHRFRADDTFPS